MAPEIRGSCRSPQKGIVEQKRPFMLSSVLPAPSPGYAHDTVSVPESSVCINESNVPTNSLSALCENPFAF